MKTILLIEKGRRSFVLQPEDEHDEEVLSILERIPKTYRDSFIKNQTGNTTNTGTGKTDLVLVFEKK